MINSNDVLKFYTHIRFQTRLDNGIAADGSLRNIRVLNDGISFYGKIIMENITKAQRDLTVLGIKNLRRAGLGRNRVFGKLEITGEDEEGTAIDILVKKALKKRILLIFRTLFLE